MKQCFTCKQVLPATSFSKKTMSKDGLRSNCKQCMSVRSRQYYQNNKEKHAAYGRVYRLKHKQIIKEKSRLKRLANKEQIRERTKQWKRATREKIITHYGGKCICCGEKEYKFLALDHKNGGGAQHKKQVGRSASFLNWIVRNNYPDIIQILCHNCNQAKGAWGICPHQQ